MSELQRLRATVFDKETGRPVSHSDTITEAELAYAADVLRGDCPGEAIVAPEKLLEVAWCRRVAAEFLDATVEHRLWDNTRVDILLPQYPYACEVDWAHKWAEGIGQALWYALNTGLPPLVLLLTAGDKDDVYVHRALAVGAKHGIVVGTIDTVKNTLTLGTTANHKLGPAR